MILTRGLISMHSFQTELALLTRALKTHLLEHPHPLYSYPRPKAPPPAPAPKSTVELQPLKLKTTPQSDKALLAQLGLSVLDHPPSDLKARRIKESWKGRALAPTVAVLVGPEQGAQRTLLHNIAKAIDVLISPCRAIPIEKLHHNLDDFLAAEDLQHIIASDRLLTGNLLAHLREFPGQSKRLLGDKPLLLLPDLNLYLKDPLLKASLWKTLCSVLSPSS